MKENRKICVGMIAGAHGVRGLVRLHSFTEEPESIWSYGPFTDEDSERDFKIKMKSRAKDFFIAEVSGLSTKEEADALRGTKLYVSRTALPKIGKREYYEVDLVGLVVKDEKGKAYGQVLAVYNYGGGPFLEIGMNKMDSFMLPFNKTCVPEVDVKDGIITIDPPDGWLQNDDKKYACHSGKIANALIAFAILSGIPFIVFIKKKPNGIPDQFSFVC